MTEGVLQLFMSFFGSLGFAFLYNLRGKKLILGALGGALSWAIYLLMDLPGYSETLRYFVASFSLAIYAEILARVIKTPATTFLIPGLIPLVPGGSLYHTMRYGLNKRWYLCTTQAMYTLKLALALALGIVAVLSVLGVINVLVNRSWYRKAVKQREKEKTP